MRFHPVMLALLVVRVCVSAPTAPVPIVWSLNAHEAEIVDLAFSADDQLLASAAVDHLIKVRRLDGTRVLTHLGNWPRAVAFSPRRNLFVAAYEGTIAAWRISPADPLQLTPAWTNEMNFGSADLAFSPDGQYIAGCFESEYGLV